MKPLEGKAATEKSSGRTVAEKVQEGSCGEGCSAAEEGNTLEGHKPMRATRS
jgi:uncharacterized low-complexity protein